MGKIFKFPKTEKQYRGNTTSSNFLFIDKLPSQVGTLTFNGELQSPTWQDLDPLKLSITGETSATNAGIHYITVTPIGNFAWADRSQSPKQIPYTIDRKKILQIPEQDGSLTFDANNQLTPSWKFYDPNELVIGGVFQNQTQGGTYTATFTPDSNHCWDDGTFAAKEVTWKIDPAKLPKPTLSQTAYAYTGSQISVTVNNFNADYMTKTGTERATDKGNYSISVALDQVNNTVWADGSADNVTLDWEIGTAKYEIPYITRRLTYNEQMQDAPLSTTDGFTIEGTDQAENVGTYKITCILSDKENSTWSDGTTSDKSLTWYVDKAVLTQVVPDDDPLYYNEQAQEPYWNFYNANLMTKKNPSSGLINAGSKTTRFTLVDTVNYKFEGTTNTYIDVSWKIEKRPLYYEITRTNLWFGERYYNGEEANLEIAVFSAINDSRIDTCALYTASSDHYIYNETRSSYNWTKAGDKIARFKLTNNFFKNNCWADNAQSFEYPIKIKKAVIQTPYLVSKTQNYTTKSTLLKVSWKDFKNDTSNQGIDALDFKCDYVLTSSSDGQSDEWVTFRAGNEGQMHFLWSHIKDNSSNSTLRAALRNKAQGDSVSLAVKIKLIDSSNFIFENNADEVTLNVTVYMDEAS